MIVGANPTFPTTLKHGEEAKEKAMRTFAALRRGSPIGRRHIFQKDDSASSNLALGILELKEGFFCLPSNIGQEITIYCNWVVGSNPSWAIRR